jgi:hypothetical protein
MAGQASRVPGPLGPEEGASAPRTCVRIGMPAVGLLPRMQFKSQTTGLGDPPAIPSDAEML